MQRDGTQRRGFCKGCDKPFLYSLELIVPLDTLASGVVKF